MALLRPPCKVGLSAVPVLTFAAYKSRNVLGNGGIAIPFDSFLLNETFLLFPMEVVVMDFSSERPSESELE